MIANTKTAEWALHIAVLQAVVGELYAGHVAGLPADQVKALNDRIVARSKACANDLALFLGKQPQPQAHLFAKEILDTADRVIGETMAEMAPAPV